MWCPLTPPMNENDVFIDEDNVATYLYESTPISEHLLPPVTSTKKPEKRVRPDSISSTTSQGILITIK